MSGKQNSIFGQGKARKAKDGVSRAGRSKENKATVVVPRRPILVRPASRDYWDDRGWERETDSDGHRYYVGSYSVGDKETNGTHSFEGLVSIIGNKPIPFIHEPPTELKGHRDWKCFRHVERGWYALHWDEPADNADEAILYIERLLAEVLLSK